VVCYNNKIPGEPAMPYSHITIDERDFLQSAITMQLDTAIIARIMGKHSATIYREAKRNSSKGYYVTSVAQVEAVP
jgi:IS30 family transposase